MTHNADTSTLFILLTDHLAGATRLAVRTNGTLSYLLTDHLGSTSLTTDSAGSVVSELRYTAWGEVRYQSGTTPTNYTYTGQYSNVSDFGLMFYGSRWYDNSLGRFAQADTIVPGGAQGLDRYAYVNNSPLNYVDPSGHFGQCHDNQSGYQCSITQNKVANLEGQWAREAAAKLAAAIARAMTAEARAAAAEESSNSGGGSKGLYNKAENCRGLECIHNHRGDDDIIQTSHTSLSPGDCLAGEKCDKAEALAGVFLIATVDLMEAVFLIIGVLAVGPMAIVPILEITSLLWIPANIAGAYLIFDSGVVKDFNRTAWGLK